MTDPGAGGRATSKHTPGRERAVLAGIAKGLSRTRAAELAGITKDTVRRWAESSSAFSARLDKAAAEYEAALLERIQMASLIPHNWTAAAWILERTRSETYGQRSRVDISLEDREYAKELAAESGLDEAEILAEANRLLAQQRTR